MGRIDWYRCQRCGRKIAEAEVRWLLTGPPGRMPVAPHTPTRPQPYPRECGAMPTLKDGATVCGGCGMEYTDYLYGEMYHP
jgi:hypothetical protein